jgi:Zn-dependent protease with chaperone function
MKTAILLGLALLPFVSFSQTNETFFKKDEVKIKSLSEGITNRYTKDVSSLEGKNKKYIAAIYKERVDLIKEKLDQGEALTDEQATNYLNALVAEVAKVNPIINPTELRVLFSREWWPNACSMGEGTIFFNIALFNRLQNESQAVFILCHELSHYYLNHGNNAIQKYITTLYSDEFQKQLKEIQKSEYRKNQQLENLAKGIAFRSHRHSREFENAADSMAIELMKKTNYDLSEALNVLALLDSVDKDKYNYPLNLSKRFDFATYPFKKTWLQTSTLSFAVVKDEKAKAEEDSLKTHPDCKMRILKLNDLVQKYNKPSNKKFIVSKERFEQLKNEFDFEIINFCLEKKDISRSLYYSLEMVNAMPENVYLHTVIGKCLNAIYSSQKKHELGKIVDLPKSVLPEEYNNLLHLIQNLRLNEIAAISYYYMQQFSGKYDNDSEFAATLKTSIENFKN